MIDVYKALSDKNRRKILEMLKEKDMSVNEIAKHFEMSQPSISNHLSILKNANLIESRKEGKYVIYSINLTVLEETLQWFIDMIGKKQKKE
ncbi:UNVERIFIED_ORG: ArsR family transcriptional regulator [Heyndrickxia coagulans]